MKHVLRAAVAALTLALLTACGSSSGVSSEHNKADVTFTTQMIPHHQQAVEMADLASSHGAGPEVLALAKRIKSEQDPEIKQMNAFLDAWGEDSRPMSGGMSEMGMDGMMSDADMRELSTARGAAFDSLFLTQMVQHHEGAVKMATTEKADGTSQEAIDLAASVVKGQTSEITKMKELLAGG